MTTTTDSPRFAGIDTRTAKPALLVLALALLMSVVLPSIDSGTSYRDEVHTGDTAEIADGVTLVPTPGWELTTGALVGHTRSPVGSTATTELVDGSVRLSVQAAPFDGTASALLKRTGEINADLDAPRAATRRYPVTTRQGVAGVARTSLALAGRDRSSPSCSGRESRRPARAWRSSSPGRRPRCRAGATTSSR